MGALVGCEPTYCVVLGERKSWVWRRIGCAYLVTGPWVARRLVVGLLSLSFFQVRLRLGKDRMWGNRDYTFRCVICSR